MGWHAAHIQADATQPGVALDQNHLEAQISGAKVSAIAAGAGTQYQQVAVEVGAASVAGRYRGDSCQRRWDGRYRLF